MCVYPRSTLKTVQRLRGRAPRSSKIKKICTNEEGVIFILFILICGLVLFLREREKWRWGRALSIVDLG